ncbi:MAG: serine/threonine protein kinase [Planctomycetes bacterium]|nr:serine/threonine protein kinase [Planctomycetota bacterium]
MPIPFASLPKEEPASPNHFHLEPGTSLGGFRIDAPLSAGGMAYVYHATQLSLNRKVALKVLARSLAQEPLFVQRFARESDILAGLSHPNIITIHDKGFDQGCYYFAMELVEGCTLRSMIAKKVLSPAETFRLLGDICGALHYAHRRGVIHRDMKPSNVLVDQDGHVKVADFGIAHLARKEGAPVTELTMTHVRLGTHHYMAPEQQFDARSVDGRADIYALGVMLYEMLTGQLPLGSFDPASSKVPGLDSRVDAVIERALRTDPDLRYANPGELATILRQIATQPALTVMRVEPPLVVAAPTSGPALIRESFLRQAATLEAAGRWEELLAAAEKVQTQAPGPDARIDGIQARAKIQVSLAKARAFEESRDWGKAVEIYAACLAIAPPEERKGLEEKVAFCRRKKLLDSTRAPKQPSPGGSNPPTPTDSGPGSESSTSQRDRPNDSGVMRSSLLCKELRFSSPISTFALNREAPAAAVIADRPEVEVYAVPGGTLTATLKVTQPLGCVVFSQDGKQLAAGGEDGFVWVWETATWERVARIDAHVGPVRFVAFSPDGSALVTVGEDAFARSWWIAKPKEALAAAKLHKGALEAARLSPDGVAIAVAGEDHVVRVWDRTNGKLLGVLPARKDRVSALTFGPQSRRLAVASWDRTLVLWDRKERSVTKEFAVFQSGVLAAAFSRDGQFVAAGGWDRSIRVWDLESALPPSHLVGHQGRVNAVLFAEKDRLISTGEDSTLRVWSIDQRKELEALRGTAKGYAALDLTTDCKYLVARTADSKLLVVFALKRTK